ncbi:flagellar hook-length control protein FliK [Stappia sp. ES.058]|uniref:flagellar hook-length control protein FliK n=1 Tax=Stappia sp. ES.058 TaxID=1881061 RepID=UPI0008799110|nr:flagellar hook-length control protein FliK [Stappia sp. ES.058]SDU30402.1 hook-length control protein FliK [Stappia sp. ES.058]
MTLANSISTPATPASAALSGQGAKSKAAAGAPAVPSMFAKQLGSVSGDVSARALSAAKSAASGAQASAILAGGATAPVSVTGTATGTGPLIAGGTSAQMAGTPFAISGAALAMFGNAGQGTGSVLPTNPAASAGNVPAVPVAGAAGAPAQTVDAVTETETAATPDAVATLTVETAAPASMSAPVRPAPSLVAGVMPGDASTEETLATGQAASANGLAARAAGAGGKSNNMPGEVPAAAAGGIEDGTPGSGAPAQGKAGSPPGLEPGSVASLAGVKPASVGAPAIGAALAAGNPVSAMRSATVTDAAITAGPAPTTGATSQLGAGQHAPSAEPSSATPQTATPQTVAATGTTGVAVPAPQNGPASGVPEQTIASAAPASAGSATLSSPSSVADEAAGLSGVPTGEQVTGPAQPRSAAQAPIPALVRASAQPPGQATAQVPAMTPTGAPTGAESASSPPADAPASQEAAVAPAAAKSAPQPDASGIVARQEASTVAAPHMSLVKPSATSGATSGAATPVIDQAAQPEGSAGTGESDGKAAAQDQAPRSGRDPATLRATTQMAINAPARDLGQPVAIGTGDAPNGEATSTLAKALAADGASTEDTASDHKPPAPTPAVAQPAQTATLRAGVSAAALAFAAAITDGQAKAGDAGLDFDGFGEPGLRGDTAQQAAATARAAATAPLPQQAAAATVHLAAEIARFASKGSTRFQIRMDPPEMGRIDVDLKIGKDGSVRAHLAVERSETLDMFLRDQRSLERALDAAGLKLENGSVQLSLKDQGGFGGFQRQDGQDEGHADGPGGDADGGEMDAEGPVTVSRVQVTGASGALDIQI